MSERTSQYLGSVDDGVSAIFTLCTGAVLEAARVAIQERALFPPAPKALATAKHPTELVAALREAGDPFADYLPPAELADIEAPRLGGFGIALSALGDGLLTGR